MRRFIAAVAIVVMPATFVAGVAHAADPSSACNAGIVPPSASPAGVGVRATSEPMVLTVTACSTAAPLPGHVRVRASADRPTATVILDGDPSATLLGCTDGYTAAGASEHGVALYHSPDGGYTSRARAKSAEEISGSVAKYCTLTPASA